MTEASSYSRSTYEAILDVRYGQRFNEINEIFYRRLDLLFGFVGLAGGTAAFTGALTAAPVVAGVAGVAIAASAIIERLVRPVEQAVAFAEFRRRFAELDARAAGMTLADIDAELRRLQAAGPHGVTGLAACAYNRNLLSNGRPDAVMPLTGWERFLALWV